MASVDWGKVNINTPENATHDFTDDVDFVDKEMAAMKPKSIDDNNGRNVKQTYRGPQKESRRVKREASGTWGVV